MHGAIEWFTRNTVAANLLMIIIVGLGLNAAFNKIPLEVFPSFETDVVNVSVSYPGATPYEIEQGIGLRIEEALSDLDSIDKVFTNASENSANIRIEITKGEDVNDVMNDIKSRIDGITGFPDGAEKPVVSQQVRRREVISTVVSGDLTEHQLHKIAEEVRDEITRLPGVTQAEISGLRPYEISIEIPEANLQRYSLTLNDVAQTISNASRDIPAGTLKTDSGDIRLRTLGQAYTGEDFENIVIISKNDGTLIRLKDIGIVDDGFTEDPLYADYDGQRSAIIQVYRVDQQSAIEVAETVKQYIAERSETLPPNVSLSYWKDRSKIVKARLGTLTQSAMQGILLIFILLALFLRPSVALWVSVGIPISFMGALALMPILGVTLNIVSMFAFIVVLGIVVDDAIVTGENVYTHLREHGHPLKAAIEGTQEVSIPVTFGVLTTVAAFIPLFMIEGTRGKIFAQLPAIIIPVLLFSLIESKLILPAHMRHVRRASKKRDAHNKFLQFQQKIAGGLENFIKNTYQPFLKIALHWRYLTLVTFIVGLLIAVTLVASGRFKFTFFPRVQSEHVSVSIVMEEGTPLAVTRKHAEKIAEHAKTLQKKHIDSGTGESIIEHILITIGTTRSSFGDTGSPTEARVNFEMTPPENREVKTSSSDLVREWRKLIGGIPSIKTMSFRSEIGRAGEPIDVQLIGQDFETLNEVAEKVKVKLNEYSGLFDIKNSFDGGKDEIQLHIKPQAEMLGLTLNDVGRQVRHAMYGVEAQRILRDNSEIKVMLRYAKEERDTLDDLKNLIIRLPNGSELPLHQVADITPSKGFSTITRVDRRRIVNVTADLDKDKTDVTTVIGDLTEWLPELLKNYPGIEYTLEGEQKEQSDSFNSLLIGVVFVLFVIYALLAIPFKSYMQPFIVMGVIPFSFIGVIIGHGIMGMNLSISSMIGVLALMGIVVNDSLVLVDYINKKIRNGAALFEAVSIAGAARFRPILLTSLTTFAGLLPLIFEKSTQAQFLIPMAVTLGFGILFATFITLLLIPVSYLILEDIKTNLLGLKPTAAPPEPD